MEKVHRPTERVIQVLNLISQNPKGLTFTEISNDTGIPKGTLSPILQTLVDYKLVHLEDINLKYKIGSKAFKIGSVFIEDIDVVDEIKKEMEEVVKKCDEICQLGTLDDTSVLYLAKVEPAQCIKFESKVGRSVPAYAAALGRCLLINFTDKEIKKMYGKKLEPLTDNTVTDIDELLKEVDTVRKTGVSFEWKESNDQIMCVAVPIKYENKAIFSLSVSVPVYRADQDKLKLIEEVLVETRTAIEKRINLIGSSNMSKFN